MSHSHIRVPKPVPVPKRRRWFEVLFIVGACPLALEGSLSIFMRSPFDTEHESAIGGVSESHVALVGSIDSRYGGHILYQIEAHVRYPYLNQIQDRWMAGSEQNFSRQILEARIRKHPNACEVYWLPNHPENAKCRFE
jgi:hypothetical protein